jgi:hypothetical protein
MKLQSPRGDRRSASAKKAYAARAETAPNMTRAVTFSPGSERISSDYDVLLGYQIFLGRNPENSFVIQGKRSQPIKELVRGFLASEEFRDFVAKPLAEETDLIHSVLGMVLGPEHISWIEEAIILPEDQRAALKRAVSWREFFGALSKIECFPIKSLEPQVSAAPEPSRATPAPDDVRITELIDGMRRIETLLRAALNGQMLHVNAEVPLRQMGDDKQTERQSPT